MTMMTPQPLDQQENEEMLVPHSGLVEGPQPLVEGPQPMEVAPTDNAGTVENQATDELQPSRYIWTINNFSRLNTKKLYSDVFSVGGYKWRVLIFPKGNNVDFLSMYLDVADSSTLPYGWNRYAQFSLAVVNHIQTKLTMKKDTQHQFNQRESDWGFTSFMPLCDLYDPNKGYLVNDTCVVEADVAVRKVIDYWTYDSKKETGFVGLKNQGATCYMNSLLQTLFHIPYFRKAMYHMPTTENDNPTGSIPLALQSLFYKLQYNDTNVATKELTKSFGWDTYDSFMQHDVQELNRVLCEKLEDKMKGTVVEGTIQKLFEGHHMNYIECINVDFKSTRKESFYDLQLDVKGCKDVYASFDKYVEVERLEGANKYHAEELGLQDAKKGVLFIDFPPVLQLQLKRFEYDFMRDTMVKINDRYEFPLELDLDRDNGKYLSPDADKSVRNLYILHSALVHSGGVHGGHYYAFIRPTLSDQWYKFDDERVTKEDVKKALEEQYGGEEELPQKNPGYNNTPFKFTKYSNAYMLVYIRVSEKDKIICDVDEQDIAEHLRIRLKKEQEESSCDSQREMDKIICDVDEQDIAEHLRIRLKKEQEASSCDSQREIGEEDKQALAAVVTEIGEEDKQALAAVVTDKHVRYGTTNLWVKLSEHECYVGVDSRLQDIIAAMTPETKRQAFEVLNCDDYMKFTQLGYGICVSMSGNVRRSEEIISHLKKSPRVKKNSLGAAVSLAQQYINRNPPRIYNISKVGSVTLIFCGWMQKEKKYDYCVVRDGLKKYKNITENEFGSGSGHKRAVDHFKQADTVRNEETVINQMLEAAGSDRHTGGNINVFHLRKGFCRQVHCLSLTNGVYSPEPARYERILFPHSAIMMFMISKADINSFTVTDLLPYLKSLFPLIEDSHIDWMDQTKAMVIISVNLLSEENCMKWFDDCVSLKGPPVGHSSCTNADGVVCRYIITKANKDNLTKAKMMNSIEDWLV